jgi:hypothetical protein
MPIEKIASSQLANLAAYEPDSSFTLPPSYERAQDQGAADAINRLKEEEAREDFIVVCTIGDPHPGPFGPGLDDRGFPGTFLVPTDNKLTGQELLGSLLEGVMDPGNELNELQQFQALRNDPAVKPDPAANRVLDVVDRWAAKLESEGRTSLTPEEKAQMTTELAQAAKPRVWDKLESLQPIKPELFAPPPIIYER